MVAARLAIVAVAAVVLVHCGTEEAAPPIAESGFKSSADSAPRLSDDFFVRYTVAPHSVPIEMFWHDDEDHVLGSIQRLREFLGSKGRELVFAMNGGMYEKDRSPVGLFIERGRVLSPLDTNDGAGNFYLKPNGVFVVRKDGTADVMPTTRFEYLSNIAYATQSGPMLVIDSTIHPVFEKESDHLNVRNGVGVRNDGTIIFLMSRVRVTLYDFAEYFRSLGCCNALYLDGFVSRCYCPGQACEQLDGSFGVMIGVTGGSGHRQQ